MSMRSALAQRPRHGPTRALNHLYGTFNVNAEPFREGEPTHESDVMTTRTIKVGQLARVEGEGALKITDRDGEVKDTPSSTSSSRRVSSKRSCRAARSPKRPISPRASAASARSPIR